MKIMNKMCKLFHQEPRHWKPKEHKKDQCSTMKRDIKVVMKWTKLYLKSAIIYMH